MPAASVASPFLAVLFQWLKPFLCFAFNFVEGFAVLAALFNFVEGFAVQWLKPFICFAFLGFCACGVSMASPFLAALFEWLKPFLCFAFLATLFLWLRPFQWAYARFSLRCFNG